MADVPCIFSAPMVQALLREAAEPGTGKSMTRRLAWRKLDLVPGEGPMPKRAVITRFSREVVAPTPWQRVKPGDRIWVREGWRWNVDYDDRAAYRVDYPADEKPPVPDAFYRWRSPIHMPRNQSRLTLIVTATKWERLNAISEVDCEREGCIWERDLSVGPEEIRTRRWFVPDQGETLVEADTAQGCFSGLWNMIHGPGEWENNPEVVALTFRVVAANIDAPEAKAA